MIALKLQLYQNLVNYRKENSFGYLQSYPLPTPSMIRGMAHNLLGLKEYKPLKISIQGSFDSVCVNMQRIIKIDRSPKSRPFAPYRVIVGSSERTALNGVVFSDNLVNCNIILHIAFDDEKLTEKLYEKALNNTVIIGRNEDIARVDFEKSRLVRIKQDNEVKLKYPVYLDIKSALSNQTVGTRYKLPFSYKDVKSFKELRIFQFVDCMYVSDGILDNFYTDDDGDAVCFLWV